MASTITSTLDSFPSSKTLNIANPAGVSNSTNILNQKSGQNKERHISYNPTLQENNEMQKYQMLAPNKAAQEVNEKQFLLVTPSSSNIRRIPRIQK
ncbi:hypothetical protein HPP92_012283 [Vanilla planifolia]|uniref:Uncharacterized protein n=1 Tax=Vanilla planifolia TaxID=51239 RepID=A0A835R4M0_VANPL|nr:hypothetical protein HPP92_012283 [Vanilla planifolia]